MVNLISSGFAIADQRQCCDAKKACRHCRKAGLAVNKCLKVRAPRGPGAHKISCWLNVAGTGLEPLQSLKTPDEQAFKPALAMLCALVRFRPGPSLPAHIVFSKGHGFLRCC
jgi:hypothetical protein